MSAPTETPNDATSPTSAWGVVLGWIISAVPAIAGTIGFLGFVAVIGAGIQWTRFESAKLPADQAVRSIPQRELVAIGAVSLIAFAVLGIMAVLLAFIVDREGDPSRSTRKALVLIALAEGLVVILLVRPPLWQTLAAAAWALAFAVASLLALRWLVKVWAQDGRRSEADHELAALEAARDTAEARYLAAEDRWESLSPEQRDPARDSTETARWERAQFEWRLAQRRYETQQAAPLAALARVRPFQTWVRLMLSKDQADGSPFPRPQREYAARRRLVYLGVAAAVMLLVVAVELALRDLSEPYWLIPVALIPVPLFVLNGGIAPVLGLIAVAAAAGVEYETARFLGALVLVAVLLGVGNLMVARATRRFVWYGLAVFFSVALFGGIVAAARSIRTPKVQPAALIRKGDDQGVCGIYVSETDDRVYLGRVEREPGTGDNAAAGTGRVFWVPKDEVAMLSIGPLQVIDRATERAPMLLAELYADRPQEPARTGKPTTKTVTVTKSGRSGVKRSRAIASERAVARERPVDRPAQQVSGCTSQRLAPLGG